MLELQRDGAVIDVGIPDRMGRLTAGDWMSLPRGDKIKIVEQVVIDAAIMLYRSCSHSGEADPDIRMRLLGDLARATERLVGLRDTKPYGSNVGLDKFLTRQSHG